MSEIKGKYIHKVGKKKEGHEDATSDFGKGFFYNIFLFAKHFERYNEKDGTKRDYSLWFYGAGDHMLEMEVPPKMAKTKLGKDFAKIRDEIVTLRLPQGAYPKVSYFKKTEEGKEVTYAIVWADILEEGHCLQVNNDTSTIFVQPISD